MWKSCVFVEYLKFSRLRLKTSNVPLWCPQGGISLRIMLLKMVKVQEVNHLATYI